MFFVSCVFNAFASAHCCLVVACWERAGLLMFIVFLLLPMWYPGSGVVLDLSIPDLCLLSFFIFNKYDKIRCHELENYLTTCVLQ